MSDLIKDISANLQKQIEDYIPEMGFSDVGTVFDAATGSPSLVG